MEGTVGFRHTNQWRWRWYCVSICIDDDDDDVWSIDAKRSSRQRAGTLGSKYTLIIFLKGLMLVIVFLFLHPDTMTIGDARIDAGAAAATTWILLDTDYHPKTQDTVLFLRTTAGIKSIKLSCPLTVNHLNFLSRSDPECQMLPSEVVFFQFSSARQKK